MTSGGVHLYASSAADGAVLVFTRDATDGGLSFAGAVSENVQSQAFRLSAVLDAENRHLYLAQATLSGDLYEKVAGSGSDAVAVFAREDGQLAFQDAVRGGPGAGGELVRPHALAVAPGNRHLYVTSERLAAVSALTLDCLGGPDELCLDGERFRVDVTWRDGRGEGVGHRVPLRSPNSGVFWFFSSENWEMLVKVLDGCRLNGRFWVFAAVTTAAGYDLRVTDTWTGEVTSYLNPLGTASPAITDTDALHGCGVDPSADITPPGPP